MKRFIQTLKDIWTIEDLRNRILYSLGLIFLYRLGSYVVLPGLDPKVISSASSSSGLFGIFNLFVGGAFDRAAIFALGIMPYISASIAIQLAGMVIPYFQKISKEGESGRNKLNQWTRYLTVIITLVQASAYVTYIKYNHADALMIPGGLFWLSTLVVLTAGTMFVMWLGEKITDRGIGNGISLLIAVGIVARLPISFWQEGLSKAKGGGIIVFLLEIIILTVILLGIVMLVQGTRRIPVQYAKRIVGNKQFMGARQFLPIKVNTAGVMPIIFAQALMFIPSMFASFSPESAFAQKLNSANFVHSFWYNIIFVILIIVFSYFYTAMIINPTQISDDLKKNGGFIPGIKPGHKTAEFIDAVISKITLPGAIFLALVAILPSFATSLGVTQGFASFFGGTSILIIVGTILDTLQQIENELLTRHYDGLMKSGKIKGRTVSPVGIAQG